VQHLHFARCQRAQEKQPFQTTWQALGGSFVDTQQVAGAGYAALTHARLTQTPQVLFARSGADLASLTPCLADAYTDSIPMICFSSQGISSDDRHQAKPGHREIPASKLLGALFKEKLVLRDSEEVEPLLSEAFLKATSGRPGVVLIEFHDLFLEAADNSAFPPPTPLKATPFIPAPDAAQLFLLTELLRDAERPLLLVGQGVSLSRADKNLNQLVDTHQLPVVTTLLGLGTLPTDHPLHMGMIGRMGVPAANHALSECDLLVVLGARLSPRQTGATPKDLCPKAHVVRVDIDLEELAQSRVHSELDLHSDIDRVLKALLSSLQSEPMRVREAWLAQLKEFGQIFPCDDFPVLSENENKSEATLNPVELLHSIDHITCDEELLVIAGSGDAQCWTARHLTLSNPRRKLLTPGGQGTSGVELPAALGAALQCPDTTVLVVTEGASLEANLQELKSLSQRNLSIKVLILNKPQPGEPSSDLHFQQIAEAYGIPCVALSPLNQNLEHTLRQALEDPGPTLLVARVDPHCKPTPQLGQGDTLDVMWKV
jgi:acetolactate synthase-1/2/3 large subunit